MSDASRVLAMLRANKASPGRPKIPNYAPPATLRDEYGLVMHTRRVKDKRHGIYLGYCAVCRMMMGDIDEGQCPRCPCNVMVEGELGFPDRRAN